MRYLTFVLVFIGLISSCNTKSSEDITVFGEVLDSLSTSKSGMDPDTTDQIPPDQYLIDAVSAETATLIRNRLTQLIAEDLKIGIVDSLSRKFIFFEYDLNADGSKEIFVGLTGPYFCGSGGCTQFILNAQGEVVTQFTVSYYPVVISTDRSNGWNDLLILSDGSYHTVKFDGKTYPGNPSVLPTLDQLPGDGLPRVLDFLNDNYPWFRF
jgi:hypothetical protein